MVTEIESILGCNGLANIINAAYAFESGASLFMRWRWWYLEVLESTSQSSAQLDGPAINTMCRGATRGVAHWKLDVCCRHWNIGACS